MLINTSRKDRHNKLNQLLRLSDFSKSESYTSPNTDDALFTVDTYSKFMSEMLQLQDKLNGQCGDLMYGLQQVIQQNKEVPLQLDTLWGYTPSTKYKVSNRGIVQPFISYRVVRPYDYKMSKTIVIDSLDPRVLASTTRIGTFDVSPITAYIMQNRHSIKALSVQKNIDVMDPRCLDMLRGVIITAQKYNVKYTFDISECPGVNPGLLAEWFSLYSADTCKYLGIQSMCIDITTLQHMLMSQLNANWLDVSSLSVRIDDRINNLKAPHTLIDKNLNVLTLIVDFNYKEIYVKELLRVLNQLKSTHTNIVVNTTDSLNITTAGLWVINQVKNNNNTDVYIVIDLNTLEPKSMIDVYGRYGKVSGLVFKGGVVEYVSNTDNSILIEYNSDAGRKSTLELRLNTDTPLKLININKLFNNLSYLITTLSDTLSLVYIDSDDILDLERV